MLTNLLIASLAANSAQTVSVSVFQHTSMTHADSSHLPSDIKSKAQFWEHVYLQLQALLEGQTNWVCGKHSAYWDLLN